MSSPLVLPHIDAMGCKACEARTVVVCGKTGNEGGCVGDIEEREVKMACFAAHRRHGCATIQCAAATAPVCGKTGNNGGCVACFLAMEVRMACFTAHWCHGLPRHGGYSGKGG